MSNGLGRERYTEIVSTISQATQPLQLSSSDGIPSTLDLAGNASSGDSVKQLRSLLMQLGDRYAFCVSGPGVFVFYFLVGRVGASDWIGLAGVGVQS